MMAITTKSSTNVKARAARGDLADMITTPFSIDAKKSRPPHADAAAHAELNL
jgi:hypothetical protein